ncbi:MAG: PIN domain-containing protein [Planctomycetota bacterium]
MFIDTAALLALINRDDVHHQSSGRVLADLGRQRAPLVTSGWVLAEFLNAACRVPLRAAALRAVARLRGSASTTVVPVSEADWQRALNLFAARPDKEWSFVDCACMLLCEDRGIRRILTSDRHFVQAGYEVLLT